MYALISWSTKNGVALGREELEVRSTSKLTIMNGEKMEPGATKQPCSHYLILDASQRKKIAKSSLGVV